MLGELLTKAARAQPDKTALVAGPHVVSYRELDARAQALVHRLLDIGLRPGDRVALHLPNGIEAALSPIAIKRR